MTSKLSTRGNQEIVRSERLSQWFSDNVYRREFLSQRMRKVEEDVYFFRWGKYAGFLGLPSMQHTANVVIL